MKMEFTEIEWGGVCTGFIWLMIGKGGSLSRERGNDVVNS